MLKFVVFSIVAEAAERKRTLLSRLRDEATKQEAPSKEEEPPRKKLLLKLNKDKKSRKEREQAQAALESLEAELALLDAELESPSSLLQVGSQDEAPSAETETASREQAPPRKNRLLEKLQQKRKRVEESQEQTGLLQQSEENTESEKSTEVDQELARPETDSSLVQEEPDTVPDSEDSSTETVQQSKRLRRGRGAVAEDDMGETEVVYELKDQSITTEPNPDSWCEWNHYAEKEGMEELRKEEIEKRKEIAANKLLESAGRVIGNIMS